MYSLFQDSLFFMPMSGVLLYKSQKFFLYVQLIDEALKLLFSSIS